MTLLLNILKIYLKTIYFFVKIFTKQENQVFFLSRQYSYISLNYRAIIKYLKKNYPEIKIKVICKKVSDELNESFRDSEASKKALVNYRKIIKEMKNTWDYYTNLHKQMICIAQSKVIIIDGYNIPVSVLKHKKNTTVIQLWHALATIKKFGYQSIGYKDGVNEKVAKILKMHANYDYVISGSDAMNPFFAEAFNIPQERVLSIGTPYKDYLLKPGTKQIQRIYEKYPILKNKINIIYSPTFRKDGRDNINEVINNINLEKYNLIITYHDKDRKKKVNNPKVLTCPDIPYRDLIKISDYVITDYSALAIEASIVETKLLFYVYDYEQYKEENGININLFEELPQYTSRDIKELVKIIEEDSYDIDILRKFKKKYVTNLNTNSTELLGELIIKHIYDDISASSQNESKKDKITVK